MQTLYKLTDQNGCTKNNTQWKPGTIREKESCANPELCSGDVYHAHTNLNLALLLNPIHANIVNPRVFECEGEAVVSDWGKAGCFSLEITEELELPEWYINKETRKKVLVQFAILCASEVLGVFEDYNSEDDRPRKAIEAAQAYLGNPDAAAYAARAARAAAEAAAEAAARAAAYAAYAARAAAYAARAAADAAADVAYAAADVAYAAADAADNVGIDFGYLADLAVKMWEK